MSNLKLNNKKEKMPKKINKMLRKSLNRHIRGSKEFQIKNN